MDNGQLFSPHDKSSLKCVILSETKWSRRIGAYAFIHSSLQQIVLPDSLTEIKTWGFFGADLISVTIPAGVTKIENSAFSYCESLKTVYIRSAAIAGQVNSSTACGDLCRYAQTVVVPADVDNSWLPEAYAYREEHLSADGDIVIYSNCAHDWQREVVLEMVPCQTDGIDLLTCVSCGVEVKNIIACHEEIRHEAQAATCLELGWDAYVTCARCDHSTYAEIPALGHDLVEHEAQAVTCLELGWDAYVTCTRCDYTTYEEIPALGHDLQRIEAKAPTCTEGGWSEGEGCTRCDYRTQGEIYPALGHELVDHEAKAATCTEIGWHAYQTCTRGDYSSYEEIPALGHRIIEEKLMLVDPLVVENSGDNAFVLEADTYYSNNHTANSSSEFSVTALYNCQLTLDYGVSSEQNYDKLSILLNGTEEAVISGEVTGQVLTLSLTAGDTVTVRYTKDGSVDQHEDRGWVSLQYKNVWAWINTDVPADTVEPDCENPVICEYCQQTVKEALGHSWQDATCTAPRTCLNCGQIEGEALGHSWLEATCTAPKTCQACDTTEGEALGHSYEDFLCTVCGYFDEPGLILAMDLDTDGKVTAFDAQILAEANAGLRQLTEQQWTALGTLTRQDILNYILGKFPAAE